MQPLIRPYKDIIPEIDPSAFIAENAVIIGDVKIAKDASIWYGCVLRGDVHKIRVGERSNIQDGTIVHVTSQKFATLIGNDVLVGHNAVIHGCTLEDGAFVGMGAVVLDGVVVESQAMVAAGALVAPGKVVKSGELWAGNPARKMRDLTSQEIDNLKKGTDHYVAVSKEY